MPRLRRHLPQYALLAALISLLALTLLYPIFLTVRGGFASDPATGSGFTLDHLRLTLADPVLREGFYNALKIATGTTILATLIALPLAVLSAGFRFPGKSLFNAAILVPMVLPPFVGAMGVRAMLGRAGALNALLGTDWDILGTGRIYGVIAVQALTLYPIIYLNAVAALANLDPALDEAAENLGASWFRRFTRITLPLIRPGLFAGGTIVFMWSFTELGTPLIFDFTRVTSVQIFWGLKEVEASAQPYALTCLMLGAAVLMYIVGKGILGRPGHAMYAKASLPSAEKPLSRPRAFLATSAFALVTALAILPHLGVVLMSIAAPGSWYRNVLPQSFTLSHFDQALTAPDAFRSIQNSLRLSFVAMTLDIILGILIAYILVRTRLWGRGTLDALCMLPLAVPGLVLAFGFVAMSLRWPFGKGGPLGGLISVFGATPNPIPLLIIAYAVRRLPFIVRSTAAGLEQTSSELEDAAMNVGATRFRAVRSIIIPLIAANVLAGGLLVFSFSMLEVSDSLILAQQTRNYPITKMILSYTERLGDGPFIACAMGVWGMALLILTLLAASSLLGKKLGSIFRV